MDSYPLAYRMEGTDVKNLMVEDGVEGDDGRKHSTKTVTYSLQMPLQTDGTKSRKSSGGKNSEPCIFPVLRWCFSFGALIVLVFVFIIIGLMFYEVITRTDPEG